MKLYMTLFCLLMIMIVYVVIDHCSEVRSLDDLRKQMQQQEAFQEDDLSIRQPIDPETRMIMDKIRHEHAEIITVSDPIKWEDE